MKTNLALLKRAAGSVLIIGLIITAILIATMLSYLSLLHRQNMAVARSQGWNAALAIAESGVEEALAALNRGALSNSLLGGSSWSINGNFYEPNVTPRTMAGGYYAVVYTPNPPPVIYSTGYARIPAIPATIKRAVEVKTYSAPLFGIGMVSRGNITFNGNNISTDSYTNRDPSIVRSNGDLATVSGVVSVGNANVYGSVYTSPAGSVTWKANGYISGGIHNDFNMEFQDVLPPFTSGLGLPSVQTNTYVFTPGNYKIDASALKNNTLKVPVVGTVRIYVTGNFDMGNGVIDIADGAKLELFVAGASTSISSVNNRYADGFLYYGLPSNTSIKFSGNDSFTGAIYAPNASMTASGGGSSTLDFRGAFIVNTLTLDGHFKLHYDEGLKFYGPFSGYKAISWREIPAN